MKFLNISSLQLFFVFCILDLFDAKSLFLHDGWSGIIKSSGKKFKATVPGGIYTDLENAKVIPKNLKGSNDRNNRWVGNETITYVTQFAVDETFLRAPKVALVFHGLDTFSNISVNDKMVGISENMFVKYVFDVKPYLKKGSNELKVVFASPIKTGNKLYSKQKEQYEVLPRCTPPSYNGECHINHMRKMQASYGWDWGPAFPSVGIWKNVELIPVSGAYVTDVSADIIKKNSYWEIVIEVNFDTLSAEKNEPFEVDVQAVLELDNGKTITNTTDKVSIKVDKKYGNTTVILQVPKESVQLWWPNGYGEQKLYKLTTNVKILDYETTNEKQIGFRTIELVQDPLERGLTFYFKVNGFRIFAKGSNYIPGSIFPELSTMKKTIWPLLSSTKDANMNMLRVWGGGMYESDLFYDLADKLGILIWQDFMFACNMYPSAEWFMSSVRDEVVQNVRRLKHHPSIAIWAGSNENLAALHDGWYGTGGDKVYEDDFIKLYVDVIKNEVEKLDPTRTYVVSSPGNGKYDDQTGYFSASPQDPYYGDVHYYNYYGDAWDMNNYQVVRFSSEYGFQALPSMETLISAAESDEDLELGSSFLKARQHLSGGDSYMKNLIRNNLIIPKGNNSRKDLENLVYLSQVDQAVSIKTETESHRQWKSSLDSDNRGFSSGALYWQLNDVWQAPSWSSIDFGGRWKILHYYAKNFFAPVLVSTRLSRERELEIYAISDLLHALENLTIRLNIYKWDSMVPAAIQDIINVALKADESKIVATLPLDGLLEKGGCGSQDVAMKNCMIELLLKNKSDDQVMSVNYVYPTKLNTIPLPVAKITMTVKPEPLPGKLGKHSDYEIELTSNNIALFVYLGTGPIRGRFSENGFHMLQGKKKVILHALQDVTPEEIMKNVYIKTLSDVHKFDEVKDEQNRESDY